MTWGQPFIYQGFNEHVGFMHTTSTLDAVDEFGDGVKLQILTVFPNFVLQQIYNCLAVRQIRPTGLQTMELSWTYFGFAVVRSESAA